MKCSNYRETVNQLPTLADLPAPPPGKTGWPWTEQTECLPNAMPSGSEWPRISIVTPNYNYGHFLEETIRSILLQGYPNLEYIIIDGSSTDSSVEIIKKYEPWLTYWSSEVDNGQAHAINKGIKQCTGDIFNWINSDDYLTKNSLKKIAIAMQGFSTFAGAVCDFSDHNSQIIENQNLSAINLILRSKQPVFHQPGLWLRLSKLNEIGALQEAFRYCFDWELTIRYLAKFSDIRYSSEVVCNFRLHGNSKTVSEKVGFEAERERALECLIKDTNYLNLHPFIEIYFRRKNWYQLLDQILTLNDLNGFQKGFMILLNACADPKVRWTRFTLGSFRKVLME